MFFQQNLSIRRGFLPDDRESKGTLAPVTRLRSAQAHHDRATAWNDTARIRQRHVSPASAGRRNDPAWTRSI
jgi:hypothetical protein